MLCKDPVRFGARVASVLFCPEYQGVVSGYRAGRKETDTREGWMEIEREREKLMQGANGAVKSRGWRRFDI